MDPRFVVSNVLQYSLLYAGLTVGAAFLLGGPGLVLVAMGGGVLFVLATLEGGTQASIHGEDPAGFGAALASGEGDHVSPREVVGLGNAGRLYYAVGVLLLGVVVVASQL
ncbi:MAG: hypothetical protein ABEI99_08815 [Halobaculum sp.]